MTTYQFSFSHEDMDLVFDIEATSPSVAVLEMRRLAREMSENEDPYVIDVGDRAYARLWVAINPEVITEDSIIDTWGE